MSDYTPAQFAARIHKTEQWVRRHLHQLPHHRFGVTVFFTEQDLTEALEQAQSRSAAPSGDDGELRPLSGRRRTA